MGKAILTPIDNPEKVVKASNCMMSDGQTSVEEAFEDGYEFVASLSNFSVQKQYVTKIKDRLHIFITAIISTSDIAANSVLGRVKRNGQNVSFASASYVVAPEYIMASPSNVIMLSTTGEIQPIGASMQVGGWVTISMVAQLS